MQIWDHLIKAFPRHSPDLNNLLIHCSASYSTFLHVPLVLGVWFHLCHSLEHQKYWFRLSPRATENSNKHLCCI